MRKHQKRFLSILTSATLLTTSLLGICSVNSSAAGAEYNYSANYVSSDINCFTNFANPDNGTSIGDLNEQYQKVEGGADVTWYVWHNGGSSKKGSISIDTSESHNTGYSLKYNATETTSGGIATFWLKLQPGTYNYSFWYKVVGGESGLKTDYRVQSGNWDECKSLSCNEGNERWAPSGFKNENCFVINHSDTDDWREAKQTVTVGGTDAQAVKFYFMINGKADAVYLSDFSVTDNITYAKVNSVPSAVNNYSEFCETNTNYHNYKMSEAVEKSAWYAWHNKGTDEQGPYIYYDNNETYNGFKSLKYRGEDSGSGAMAFNWLKLMPGKYKFSFSYKGKGYTDGADFGWYVACTDWAGAADKSYNAYGGEWGNNDNPTEFLTGAGNDQVQKTGQKTDWYKITADITVPGTAAQAVRFYFTFKGQITALWLSDFSVISADEAAAEHLDLMADRSEKLTDILPICSGAKLTYDNEYVTIENGEIIANTNGNSTLKITLADGSSQNYSISAYPFGDVNKSGGTDIIDLIHLKKAAAGIISDDGFYNLGRDGATENLITLRKILLGIYQNSQDEVPETSRQGLYVKNGSVKLAGNDFYGIGTNYFDAFNKAADDNSLETGIANIKNSGIPYIRARFSPYQYDDDMRLFLNDRDAYFARTDRFVQLCEENSIGIIADIMWTPYPYLGRTQSFENFINNPECVGYREMLTYIKAVVERYKYSKALWGWEISNELNLQCDYTGLFGHLTSDDVTNFYDATAAYIRKCDGSDRIVSNGNSQDFGTSYQMRQNFGWKSSPLDTLEQQKAMSELWNRTMSVSSIHVYDIKQALNQNTVTVSEYLNAMVNITKGLNKPLFIGEYCDNNTDNNETSSRTRFDTIHNAVMDNDIQLACLWIYSSDGDLYASPDGHTEYMLSKAKAGNETFVSAGKQITASYWN